MKPETIVRAMDYAHLKICSGVICNRPGLKRVRQYHAFRSRILRMFAEKDAAIKRLKRNNSALASALVDQYRWSDIDD